MGITERLYPRNDRFVVENRANFPIQVCISKYSWPTGSDDWFILQQGGSDSWERRGWEFVIFRDHGGGVHRCGVYRLPGLKLSFTGFSDLQGVGLIEESGYPPPDSFLIQNRTQVPVEVLITKYSNITGSDKWFILQPGESDTWRRMDWEGVAFRVGDQRWGVYLSPSKKLKFHNFP